MSDTGGFDLKRLPEDLRQIANRAFLIQEELDTCLRDLPALPAAIMRVIEETNKQEPSAQKVEAHIASDQALAAKLLRVVNSAYYGLSGQVSTVSQAIVILGLQQVRNLALSVAALSTFTAKTQKQQETLRVFWIHALATAFGTNLIAREKKIDSRSGEVMFVGGLLHDIGRLFLFSRFPETYERVVEIAEREGYATEEVETVVFGIHHGHVGYEMALRWKLPTSLAVLIRDHEGPFDGMESPLVYGVHAADCLTKHLYSPRAKEDGVRMAPVVERWMGQPPELLSEMAETLRDRVEQASALYGVLAA